MKTPSFFELKTIVELIQDELIGARLQEVVSTEDGLVLSFYQSREKSKYLVFDLDRPFPFVGLFSENPWPKQKKTKPVSLFLNAHAKNRFFEKAEVLESLGRVLKFFLKSETDLLEVEVRLIPKHANFIVRTGKKSISWYPVKPLAENDLSFTLAGDEEVRSVNFMMQSWLQRRGQTGKAAENSPKSSLSPYEKWLKNRKKDLEKKQKAVDAILKQIKTLQDEEWAVAGEHLKNFGFKNLKPELSIYVDFEKRLAENIQRCFEKAKASKGKIAGSRERLEVLRAEIRNLADLSEQAFATQLTHQQKKAAPPERKVEGRLRKTQIPEAGITAYMGKSAGDNMRLLKNAKPFDLWLHLKDYPSAHAIIHRQKNQNLSDSVLKTICTWFVHEGLTEKQAQLGGKFAVVIAECRYVKPLKGDKIGRVTYHNAREVLIAL